MNTPTDRLDATFAALADPTRRAILSRLQLGEASVTELAAPFAMSQPAISKHLKVLERAGLVSRGRDAQRRPVRLEAQALREAMEFLDGYRRQWAQQFDRLDDLLDEIQLDQFALDQLAGDQLQQDLHGRHHAPGPIPTDESTGDPA